MLRDKVLSEDRDICYSDLETHLQQPHRELNAWITAYQGLISYSVRVANLAARSNTLPITEHFPPLYRRRKRYKRRTILPEPTAFRNMKLTSFISVTRHLPRPESRQPIVPTERRPILRQMSLHNLWPDPLG